MYKINNLLKQILLIRYRYYKIAKAAIGQKNKKLTM